MLIGDKLDHYDFEQKDRIMASFVIGTLEMLKPEAARERLERVVTMGEQTEVHAPELIVFLNECIANVGTALQMSDIDIPEKRELDEVFAGIKADKYVANMPDDFAHFMVDMYREYVGVLSF